MLDLSTVPNRLVVRVAHRMQNFMINNEPREYKSGYTEIPDIDTAQYNRELVDYLLENGWFVVDLKVTSSAIDSGVYVMEVYLLEKQP